MNKARQSTGMTGNPNVPADTAGAPQHGSPRVASIDMNSSSDTSAAVPQPAADRDAEKEAGNITNVLNPVILPDRKDKPYPDLFHTKEGKHAEQGIDPTAFPELNLPIQKLKTPSGMKEVIAIMDTLTMEPRPTEVDFLPGYDLPEIGYVWSGRQETVAGEGLFIPTFSARTTEQMKFCNLFHSGCLVRLVCKTPLTTAISFWVHRTSRANSIDTFRSEPGFAWQPSKQNEIFVLMPWAASDVTLPYNTSLDNAFLNLGIRPLSDLVREEGTATTLDVSVYFCPYQMRLYVPRPVALTVGASIITETVTGLTTGQFNQTTLPQQNVGTLTVDGNCKINVSAFETGSTTNDSYRSELIIDGFVAATIDLNDNVGGNEAKFSANALDVTSGPYPRNLTVAVNTTGPADSGFYILQNGLRFTANSLTGVTPMWSDMVLPSNEVEEVILVSLEGWNPVIHLDSRILDPISKLANGLHLSQQSIRYDTKVLSQNPNKIEVKCYIQNSLVATTTAPTAKAGRKELAIAIIPFCNFTLRDGEQQIFEYEYNTRSRAAERFYGRLGDHSVREDTHWQQFTDINITEAAKGQLYNVSFNLSNIPSAFPPVATREYSRHLLKTRVPNIKLQTMKTPFSNALARVTVGTQTTTEEAMQLPGMEWDMSNELRFEPYWIYRNPAVKEITINLTIMLLSASVSDAGMQIIALFNTGNLEYFHMRDYDFALSTIREGEQQIGGAENENECHGRQTRFDSTSISEATSAMTDMQLKERDAAETHMGARQKFCGVVQANISTVKMIAIPISHANFPKAIVNTAKKYLRWRGNPKFDVNIISNVTLAAPAYVAQVDADFDFNSNGAVDAIYMQPTARELIRGNTTQIMARWRQESGSPWQRVNYSGVPQLGYLVIAFPLNTTTLSTLDPNVKITIECDTSDFEYSIATYAFDNFDYPGLQFTTYEITPLARLVNSSLLNPPLEARTVL